MTTENHPVERLLGVCLCALALSGCGRQSYELSPVSGRVTLDDRPLANAHVSFQPMAAGNPNPGPGSFGITDGDGRFHLQTVGTRKDGAVVGQHVVRIMMRQQDTAADDVVPPRDTSLPSRADDGSLRFQVHRGGTDQADFRLVSKG